MPLYVIQKNRCRPSLVAANLIIELIPWPNCEKWTRFSVHQALQQVTYYCIIVSKLLYFFIRLLPSSSLFFFVLLLCLPI